MAAEDRRSTAHIRMMALLPCILLVLPACVAPRAPLDLFRMARGGGLAPLPRVLRGPWIAGRVTCHLAREAAQLWMAALSLRPEGCMRVRLRRVLMMRRLVSRCRGEEPCIRRRRQLGRALGLVSRGEAACGVGGGGVRCRMVKGLQGIFMALCKNFADADACVRQVMNVVMQR